MIKRISKESIASGLFAGFMWGGWAFYANFDHGILIAAHAAIAQGISSAFLGSALTMTMDYVFTLQRFSRPVKIIASIFLPMILATVLLVGVHYANGTPNIFKTMLPAQPVGYIWTLLYTIKLYGLKVRAGRLPVS